MAVLSRSRSSDHRPKHCEKLPPVHCRPAVLRRPAVLAYIVALNDPLERVSDDLRHLPQTADGLHHSIRALKLLRVGFPHLFDFLRVNQYLHVRFGVIET